MQVYINHLTGTRKLRYVLFAIKIPDQILRNLCPFIKENQDLKYMIFFTVKECEYTQFRDLIQNRQEMSVQQQWYHRVVHYLQAIQINFNWHLNVMHMYTHVMKHRLLCD